VSGENNPDRKTETRRRNSCSAMVNVERAAAWAFRQFPASYDECTLGSPLGSRWMIDRCQSDPPICGEIEHTANRPGLSSRNLGSRFGTCACVARFHGGARSSIWKVCALWGLTASSETRMARILHKLTRSVASDAGQATAEKV